MIQDKLETELNDDICEAVNCSAKVATTILVKAGDRSVALNLCNSCISKFEDTTAVQHSRIIRLVKEENKLCSSYYIIKCKDKVNLHKSKIVPQNYWITTAVERLSYLEKVET